MASGHCRQKDPVVAHWPDLISEGVGARRAGSSHQLWLMPLLSLEHSRFVQVSSFTMACVHGTSSKEKKKQITPANSASGKKKTVTVTPVTAGHTCPTTKYLAVKTDYTTKSY